MNTDQFRGTGVATITPFQDGKLDLDALSEIIDFQITQGVDYLVCLGTTGEAITLSHEETQKVLHLTIDVNAKRVPLVFGIFGGNNTQVLASKLAGYNLAGVDAVLSSSPAYNKPTQEGIYQHYRTLAEKSPRPIIIYNVPGRTCSNISAETILRLSAIDNIIGVKDASADMVQAAQVIKQKPADFLMLSGDDPTTLSLLASGGDGVISVIANAYPGPFSKMVKAGLAGDFTTARNIHLQLLDIHPLLYAEGNPAGIKGAMEILGKCTREVRLPLVPLSNKSYQDLQLAMQKLI
ncbi:MAG: 4-hydroxy-tetrahydrodipicolinate synthase [Saprospiraceae bacterium]|nr:4-hydroxy-tetrahydrodipicolinate synthase [Saprospiraceae bacterium]